MKTTRKDRNTNITRCHQTSHFHIQISRNACMTCRIHEMIYFLFVFFALFMRVLANPRFTHITEWQSRSIIILITILFYWKYKIIFPVTNKKIFRETDGTGHRRLKSMTASLLLRVSHWLSWPMMSEQLLHKRTGLAGSRLSPLIGLLQLCAAE